MKTSCLLIFGLAILAGVASARTEPGRKLASTPGDGKCYTYLKCGLAMPTGCPDEPLGPSTDPDWVSGCVEACQELNELVAPGLVAIAGEALDVVYCVLKALLADITCFQKVICAVGPQVIGSVCKAHNDLLWDIFSIIDCTVDDVLDLLADIFSLFDPDALCDLCYQNQGTCTPDLLACVLKRCNTPWACRFFSYCQTNHNDLFTTLNNILGNLLNDIGCLLGGLLGK